MSEITDDKRREVARRLRARDVSHLTSELMDGPEGPASLLACVAEDITDYRRGMHYAPYYFDARPFLDLLADLIDPDAPKCSEATPERDSDALLALADEIEHTGKGRLVDRKTFEFTLPDGTVDKTEGFIVEHAPLRPDTARDWVDRIRRACGAKEVE